SRRYCDACRACPRCASCEKVGGGHLAWCSLAQPVPSLERSEAHHAQPMTMRDLGWSAGFLEGEGRFPAGGSTVTANQKEPECLERLRQMFGGRLDWRPEGGTYGIYVWYVNGPAARGLMMTLYSLMSSRRRDQIRASLANWRKGAYRGQGHRTKRVRYMV